jgi:PKHD-type hydroxylase
MHVDSALMEGMRADVAVTLFLSRPEDYSGGDLIVEAGAGERRYRLLAGDAIVYPATTLHRVAPVELGARLAAVTWAQSHIRDAAQRKIAYELSNVVTNYGDRPYAAQLRRSYQNLLRMWVEA